MKKIITIFTIILVTMLASQKSYALNGGKQDNYSSEIYREASERGISVSAIEREKLINRIKNESIIKKNGQVSTFGFSNDGRYVSSNVKLIRQTTYYNCGATAALQVLYGMNCQSKVEGKSDSEKIKKLMEDAMTNSEVGTYVYKLTETLNNYSSLQYTYTSCKDMDESILRGKINDSLFYDTAPIIHADTSTIPYYNGHVSGHYIAISQLDLKNNIVRVKDCNYYSQYYGTHDITLTDVYNSIHTSKGDRYLIHLNK